MNDKRCALCKDGLDTEHPLSVYGINPETFRKAWMHFDCYHVACETALETPSTNPIYENRFDELTSKYD
jgi:hypothetical protein